MSERLTLREARRQFGIPVRKLAFLIRTGLIAADLEGEKLLISDSELRRYGDQPREVPVLLGLVARLTHGLFLPGFVLARVTGMTRLGRTVVMAPPKALRP